MQTATVSMRAAVWSWIALIAWVCKSVLCLVLLARTLSRLISHHEEQALRLMLCEVLIYCFGKDSKNHGSMQLGRSRYYTR